MANRLFDFGREAHLIGNLDWIADNIKLHFQDIQAYQPNTATDQFLSDIPAGIVATSGNFVAKTSNDPVGGVAGADPVLVNGVTGPQFEEIVIYEDDGVAASSILIALIDTANGMPATPAAGGSNIEVIWAGPPNRIYKL